MNGYFACNVGPAALAQLHVVFVTDVVWPVMGKEVF